MKQTTLFDLGTTPTTNPRRRTSQAALFAPAPPGAPVRDTGLESSGGHSAQQEARARVYAMNEAAKVRLRGDQPPAPGHRAYEPGAYLFVGPVERGAGSPLAWPAPEALDRSTAIAALVRIACHAGTFCNVTGWEGDPKDPEARPALDRLRAAVRQDLDIGPPDLRPERIEALAMDSRRLAWDLNGSLDDHQADTFDRAAELLESVAAWADDPDAADWCVPLADLEWHEQEPSIDDTHLPMPASRLWRVAELCGRIPEWKRLAWESDRARGIIRR